MYLGGLDVGSSGCKLTVYRSDGMFIESHYLPYDASHSESVHTIDANAVLSAVRDVIAVTESPLDSLGISSFGESFVLLDENDNILNQPMLYSDRRGSEECLTYDRDYTISVACTAPAPLYSLPKLKWTAKHRPDLLAKTKRISLIGDFIIYILTGERVITYSAAARTMGLDVRRKCWDKRLFAETGISETLMPTLVPEGTFVGMAHALGLTKTKIIASAHDQNVAAIGAGALTVGDCVDGSGSVECLTPIMDKLPENNTACEAGAAFMPYIDNLYEGCAFSYTGGTALKWFRDTLGGGESYAGLDATCGSQPGNILLMPHFAGAASPYMDSDSRAMFWGVTLATTKYDLYRAVMEGVAYEMRVNLDLLRSCGICPTRLLATGGGAKSRIWTQMKADITDLPITVVDAPEVGAAGIVMISARTLGIVSTLGEAKALFSQEGETLLPNQNNVRIYSEQYEKYRRMYQLSLALRNG